MKESPVPNHLVRTFHVGETAVFVAETLEEFHVVLKLVCQKVKPYQFQEFRSKPTREKESSLESKTS